MCFNTNWQVHLLRRSDRQWGLFPILRPTPVTELCINLTSFLQPRMSWSIVFCHHWESSYQLKQIFLPILRFFFQFFQAGVYFHLRQVVVFILKRAKASNNEITTCTYYLLTINVCEHGSPAHQFFKPLVYKAQQSEKGVLKGRHRQPVVKFSLYL